MRIEKLEWCVVGTGCSCKIKAQAAVAQSSRRSPGLQFVAAIPPFALAYPNTAAQPAATLLWLAAELSLSGAEERKSLRSLARPFFRPIAASRLQVTITVESEDEWDRAFFPSSPSN